MEYSKDMIAALSAKLQRSRLRLLEEQPFYGFLLLYMKFSLDISAETAYTDGERIAFDPAFLAGLTDSETDFVLMHEILHAALSHTSRGSEYKDQEAFNIAADIVVNSNILRSKGMDRSSISIEGIGESMHRLPDGREGYDFSAEEVYPLVLDHLHHLPGGDCDSRNVSSAKGSWDNHEKWENEGSSGSRPDPMEELWVKRMADATELINSMDKNISGRKGWSSVPAFAERMFENLHKSTLDWRTILQNFVQEDIVDYSFFPPDRRFDGGDFFLPDFNETDESVRNILFMADTSGSISDDMLCDAVSEIKGALDQFNGRLSGLLGFFDAEVYDPIPFDDVQSLLEIRPKGGGGTDFGIVFDYVRDKMKDPPSSIVILTDGYADFPDESAARGIPVLWIISNDEVTPEWGKVARIGA